MIHLVTIDCWDTILKISPDSVSRLRTIAKKVFLSNDSTITEAMIVSAFREEDSEFSYALAEKMITIPTVDRLKNLARHARVQLSEQSLNELKEAFDAAILNPPTDLVSEADVFLARVKRANVRICLICNTGWFSARAITMALERHDLARFFDSFVYSDEVGAAKPSSKIFDVALKAMETPASETVHIGNTLTTDVKGALNAGLHAVHFHPGGKCASAEIWCASDYPEIWAILSGRLGLPAEGSHIS